MWWAQCPLGRNIIISLNKIWLNSVGNEDMIFLYLWKGYVGRKEIFTLERVLTHIIMHAATVYHCLDKNSRSTLLPSNTYRRSRLILWKLCTIEQNHSISRDTFFRNYFMKLEKGLDLTPLFCSSNQTPTFSNDKDQWSTLCGFFGHLTI